MLRVWSTNLAVAAAVLLCGCATLLGLDEERELGTAALGGAGAGSEGGAGPGGAAAGGAGGLDYRQLIERDSPIAYYTFDESSGTFEDFFGDAPSIIPIDGVGYEPSCMLGGCARFDGDDDSAVAGDSFQFPGVSSMTIEVWVNAGPLPGHYQQLVGKRRVTPGTPEKEDGYSLSINPGSEVVFARLAGIESRNVNAAITPGQFVHVVATFDEWSGTSTIWVDSHFGEALKDAGGVELVDTAEPFRLAGATSINFGGQLDELALYDYALTSAQIEEHFAALSGR